MNVICCLVTRIIYHTGLQNPNNCHYPYFGWICTRIDSVQWLQIQRQQIIIRCSLLRMRALYLSTMLGLSWEKNGALDIYFYPELKSQNDPPPQNVKNWLQIQPLLRHLNTSVDADKLGRSSLLRESSSYIDIISERKAPFWTSIHVWPAVAWCTECGSWLLYAPSWSPRNRPSAQSWQCGAGCSSIFWRPARTLDARWTRTTTMSRALHSPCPSITST